jgi:hypothetical protein
MAALGQTDITTSLVRNALGETTNDVGSLCDSELINKWSMYKPVTGTRPISTNNYYAINFPTNWDYIHVTDGYRLGDFRAYNHASLPPLQMNFYPTGTQSSDRATFIVDVVSASSTELDIEDFGLEDWYFGVMLDLGGDIFWWQTAELSPGLTGYTLGDDARTVSIAVSTGAISWYAFVSDAACVAGAEPPTYLFLPAHTGLVISGDFIVDYSEPYYTFVNNVTGVTVGGPYGRYEDHINFAALNIGAGIEVEFWTLIDSVLTSIGTAYIEAGTPELPVETVGIIGNVPALGVNETGEIVVEPSV